MYNFHVFTVIFRSSPFSHENVELANHTSPIFLTWTFRQRPIALYQNIQASQRRVQSHYSLENILPFKELHAFK